MKIEKQFLEDHQVKLIVEIESDRLDEAKRQAASKLARRVKIPGFRPGKAPYPVIQRTLGEAAILEEAIELLVDKSYSEIIDQSEIHPYGPGRLDSIPSMDPLTLEIIVPLDAEVKLGDYSSIRKPYEPEEVTEEDIQTVLDSLLEQLAILEPVERPAAFGDVVTLLLEGKKIGENGEEDEIIFPERSTALMIEQTEDEWPFPGFSAGLINKPAGAEDTVEYQFPDDFSEESFRGVKTSFRYRIEGIKSRTLPELNDEFASTIGEFETLDSLKQNIRESLERQTREKYNETYDEEIIEELIEKSEFTYASQMLEDEIEQVRKELVNRLENQGLDMDIYLKSRKMDEQALKDEITPVAEKRLKRGLVLYELGKVENIEVAPEELRNEAGQTLNMLQQVLPKNEARRLKDRNVQNSLINNVLVDLLTRKTLDRLREISSGKYQEAKAAPEEIADSDRAEDHEPKDLAAESTAPSAADVPIPDEPDLDNA